jgi:U3 small nucleolar RNA-associated protein 4
MNRGDQMIVSGDSLGRIVIWDANLGTMLQTLDHHKADVLCLTGGDATSFYSAGVDRKLNYYKYVEAVKKKRKGESNTIYKWVLAESVTAHAHDVRSLDLCTKPSVNSVISGGVGVQMVACRHNLLKAGPRRLPLNPAVPLISLAPKARMMLSRFDHSVRIWQLGESQLEDLDTITDKELGERIDMKKSFRILLEMQMQGVNNLVASTISQDGQWVAVSDLQHVKLFRIVPHAKIRGRLVARKVKAFSMGENYALLLMFTPDASKLVAVTPNGVVCVVDLTTWQEQTFPISELQLKMQATVRSLDISADGQWIAVGDHANTIYLVQMDPFKVSFPFFAI